MRRLLNRATPPSQEYVRHRHVPRLVEPFLPYLLQRWADGCRNGRQLTREIEQLGYLGKGSAVRWMIARWRPAKARGQPKRRLLTRHVPWLLLRAPGLLKQEERADLEGPCRRGFDTVGAERPHQAHDAKAGAEPLFGVRPALQDQLA